MMRRVLPPRYESAEGRLVEFGANFQSVEGFPIDLWAFNLDKIYIPWDTWDAYYAEGAPRPATTPPEYVRGPLALKTLPKEHVRTLESVTLRIRSETDVISQQGWRFAAYQRHFRYMAPALVNAFNDILPFLQDSAAYQWDMMKNVLVSYADSAGLDYPQLRDPGYFEAHRLEALTLWEMLECIAQTMAAKWELGFGECGSNPDPTNFQLPNLDQAVEVGGWMLNHFPDLRDGELPMPFSRFVDEHRHELQPQANISNVQELADEFGSETVPDLFGVAWAQRFGYEALLADLENSLASPEQLIGLGWLYNQRLMR